MNRKNTAHAETSLKIRLSSSLLKCVPTVFLAPKSTYNVEALRHGDHAVGEDGQEFICLGVPLAIVPKAAAMTLGVTGRWGQCL